METEEGDTRVTGEREEGAVSIAERIEAPRGPGSFTINTEFTRVIQVGPRGQDVVRVTIPCLPGAIDPTKARNGDDIRWEFLINVEIRVDAPRRPAIFAILDTRSTMQALWESIGVEYPGLYENHEQVSLQVHRRFLGPAGRSVVRMFVFRDRVSQATLREAGLRDLDRIELYVGLRAGKPMEGRLAVSADVWGELTGSAVVGTSSASGGTTAENNSGQKRRQDEYERESDEEAGWGESEEESGEGEDEGGGQEDSEYLSKEDHMKLERWQEREEDETGQEAEGDVNSVCSVMAKEKSRTAGVSFRDVSLRDPEEAKYLGEKDYVKLDALHGVTPSVQTTYDQRWELWREFMDGRGLQDDYLLKKMIRSVALKIIGLFIIYLGEPPLNKKGEQVGLVCSGVRNGFVKMMADESLWSESAVTWAKRSHRTSGKARATALEEHQKLPAPAEFFPYMRSIAAESLAGLMVYLACVFIYVTGVRYANVGHTSRMVNRNTGAVEEANKHSLTRDEVFFDCGGRRLGIPALFEEVGKTIEVGDVEGVLDLIDAVVVKFLSGKVWKVQSTIVFELKPGGSGGGIRRDATQYEYARDLARWILFQSGHGYKISSSSSERVRPYVGSALVFSKIEMTERKSGDREYRSELQRNACSSMTKRAAEHFGLDPKKFSVYSLKHGGITELTESGATQETVQRFAGHKKGSNSTERYQLPLDSGPRPALAGSGSFTIHKLRRIVQVPESACAKQHTEGW